MSHTLPIFPSYYAHNILSLSVYRPVHLSHHTMTRNCIVFQLCRSIFLLLAVSASVTAESHSRTETLSLAKRVARPNKKSNPIVPQGGSDGSTSLKFAVTSGILLAFNSGFVNGCCLSGGVSPDGTKQAVAAVTGAWTTSAVSLASGNSGQFKMQLNMILSYILGSAVSGFTNPRPSTFQISPTYGPLFFLGSALLTGASHMAKNAEKFPANSYFYMAAIANGMQNSLTSTHTANLCRTAHFSGISSDIGTFLGQVIRGNYQNLTKLKVFCSLGLAFFLGGYVSFYATDKFASSSLLFSAFLYFIIGSITLLMK